MPEKHSVLLKEDECEGCTNCVKNCPTRAIRVLQGKASIKDDLCIDCAECIRTCEYHAKYTQADALDSIKDYSYPVLLVPPSFYGQFNREFTPGQIVHNLKRLGFKQVFNVARAAEALSRETATFLQENDGFYISSSCPVIVRIIQKIYPELVDHLMPLKSPVEATAQLARQQIIEQKQIKKEDVGVFFVTPCPAKLTSVHLSPGLKQGFLDGAIAVEAVYEKLLPLLENDADSRELSTESVPYSGIIWGQSGGEADILNFLQQKQTLSVAGIGEVKKVLEELARDNITGIRYFELVSCPEGCVGGVLNVLNPYQATFNIKDLVNEYREKLAVLPAEKLEYDFSLKPGFTAEPRGKLDEDMEQALKKLARLEEEKEILPGLDCASCGAPDCETLAEDIVQGKAKRTDCIFMLRQEIQNLAEQISSLTHELPPVMAENEAKKEDKEENDRGVDKSES